MKRGRIKITRFQCRSIKEYFCVVIMKNSFMRFILASGMAKSTFESRSIMIGDNVTTKSRNIYPTLSAEFSEWTNVQHSHVVCWRRQ